MPIVKPKRGRPKKVLSKKTKPAPKKRGRPKKIVKKSVKKRVAKKVSKKKSKKKVAKKKVVKKRVSKKSKKKVVKKRVSKKMKGGAASVSFYFPKNFPYASYADEYESSANEEVAKLMNFPNKQSVIYTHMNLSGKNVGKYTKVYTYEGPMSESQIEDKSIPVKVKDIFEAHTSKLNGKTICGIISENTGIALESLSYMAGSKNNILDTFDQCENIHAKIHLTEKIIGAKEEQIMNLLEVEEYDAYCRGGTESKDTCEGVKSWMTPNKGKVAAKSICNFTPGTFKNSCEVNTSWRDEIIEGLRKKIDKCVADMGAVTGRTGKRRHIRENFGNEKIAHSQICVKRSFKATVKASMRMKRLYKILGNMNMEEQLDMVNKTSMSASEKETFTKNLAMSDKEGESIIKGLNIDGPTEKLLQAYSTIMRETIQQEFYKLTNAKDLTPKSGKSAEEQLAGLTSSKEEAGYLMSAIKGTARAIISALAGAGKILFKAIAYFSKKGFNLLKWIFNHPSTCMWLTYTGVFLKKKVCEFISIKMYGDPEIVEIGIMQYGTDFKKYTADQTAKLAKFIKRSFLSFSYNYIDSAGFGAIVGTVTTMIEAGILYVISIIPGFGIVLATAIKTSGGLSVVLSTMAQVTREAMYYGFTAMMVKEAGTDFYDIITTTCIQPPAKVHQLTLGAIKKETGAMFDSINKKVAAKSEDLGAAFNSMMKTGFSVFT